MILFFVNNPMSQYYKSSVVQSIIESLNKNQDFELKQNDNRLRLVNRKVENLEKAYALLGKLGK